MEDHQQLLTTAAAAASGLSTPNNNNTAEDITHMYAKMIPKFTASADGGVEEDNNPERDYIDS
jgi:hypothetical protein